MKLYAQIIKNTISEYLVYRLNFILWRVRMSIRLLVIYFLWQAIFQNRGIIYGYDRSQMMTYILLSQVVGTFVQSTKTQDVGNEIQQGNLTNWLLRPINYFQYLISRDIADKLLNLCFACMEITLISMILRPQLALPQDPLRIIMFIFAVIIGVCLFFCLSLLLGLFSFWTFESWAPRFLFIMISEFLSGGLFPLDILPPLIYKSLLILPFPYLLYFPLEIFIGKFSYGQIVVYFMVGFFWITISGVLLKLIWQKGMKVYTAEGR